jgi:formate-dependent nitrite reductase membrane component NrfD
LTYYDLPLLKPPVWTWEVPAYFFTGGTAGAAACIGFAARLTGGDPQLIRHAQWIAFAGATVSGPLLISDLGRPERFMNMLRVFKPQSPMSVGAWLLAAFGAASGAAIVTRGTLRDIASAVAAVTGLGMATYTGVLIGATSIPVWSGNVRRLPAQFGISSLASAAATLELLGHRDKALRRIGKFSAAAEVVLHAKKNIETTEKLASVFSGPLPLALRLLYGSSVRARQAAAVSSLIGSMLTRVAWIEAGKRSARGDAARAGQPVGK